MTFKLWVDDLHGPEDLDPQWRRAYTSAEAIELLEKYPVDLLSLDYSLGTLPGGEWDDGTKVLEWLRDHPDRWPPVIEAHSRSTSGCAMLERMIKDWGPKP